MVAQNTYCPIPTEHASYVLPMPAVTELRTPPATQGQVVALWAQGTSKRQIAKDLGIDKNTVAAILKAYSQDQPNSVSRVQQIIPKAYDAVEKALSAGDGNIAMQFLKATDLAEGKSPVYRVEGDMHLSQTMQLLPSTTARTEAAAKVPPHDLSLSNHTNFSASTDAITVLPEPTAPDWCEQGEPEDECLP